MNDGIIVVNKNKNCYSQDVLRELRRLLNIKKIGHTGSLDINAKGVLICLVDSACAYQDFFMDTNKIYIAELLIGISTDTEDITGNIININNNIQIDNKKLNEVINSFIGSYEQIPPMFSSKKVNGKKLLDLAKKGQIIERKPSKVYINDIKIVDEEYAKQYIDLTDLKNNKNDLYKVYIKVECKKGTYIRTLCKDIGSKLGYFACMGNLTRISNCGFDIKDSLTIDQIKNKINNNDYSFIKPALYSKKDSVVTFGKFESLHIGHQKIISEVLKNSNNKNLSSIVIIVKNLDDSSYKNILLNKIEQKSYLRQMGVDNVLFFDLTETNKKMSGEYFLTQIIKKQLRAKMIIVGSDCSFGYKGMSDALFLKNFCDNNNIDTMVIDKVEVPKEYNIDAKYVSTTLIKKLIEENKFDIIEKLINRRVF